MNTNTFTLPKLLLRFVLAFTIMLALGQAWGQTTRTLTAGTATYNGAWSGGTWTGGFTPVSGDIILMYAGTTININSNFTINRITLSSDNGANTTNLNVGTGATLTVTNDILLNSAAGNNTACTIAGLGAISSGSVLVGTDNPPTSTATRNTTMTSTLTSFSISGNLTIRSYIGTSTARRINSSFVANSGTVTVNGSVTTTNENAVNTSTFTLGNSSPTLILAGATPFSLSGTITSNITLNGTGATVNYSGAAQTVRATTYTNLTLSGSGAKTTTGVTVNGVLSMEGNGTVSVSDAPTYVAGSSTLQYKGAAAQTTGVEFPTTFSGIGGVIINNSSGVNLGGNKTISNALTLTAGEFAIGANTLTLTGNLSGTGALSITTGTLNIGGNNTHSGTFTCGTGTVDYYGTGQTVRGTTYNNLRLTGSGTKTLGAAVTVGANLAISGTALANLGTFSSTANSLSLLGNGQVAGTYGGTGSGATNILTTYFAAATGVLTVATTSCNEGLWNGTTSTDWHIAANWCNGILPTAATNVVIPAGGNQPIIGAAAVCNNLTIDAGATLTITGTNTLTISGNFTNNGTFTPNSSTVTLNGTAQNLAGGTYYNLTIDGGSVKTLAANTIISNVLTLTNGNLSLGSYNLTVNNAVAGTFNNTHMIVTDGTGTLIRQSATAAGLNMTYPVGTGSNYTPMTLASTAGTVSGTATVSVRAVAGRAPYTNSGDLNKYWITSTNNLSAFTTTASFLYVNPGEVLGTQAIYRPKYTADGGTTWVNPTGSSGNGANPLVSTGTTTLTGIWTAFENVPTFYSLTSLDWTSFWNTAGCGSIWPLAGDPSGYEDVIICTDDVVTLDANRTIRNVTVKTGGVLDLANRNLTITGNLILEGSILSQNGELIFNTAGTIVRGGGVFTASNTGFVNIDADITINGTDLRFISSNGNKIIDIATGVTVTNNGITTATGDVIGNNATTSVWTNTSNSSLSVDGALLATGVLNASASGNQVEYISSRIGLNIKTPSTNTYHHLKINGTTTKTQLANLIVNGDFEINSGTYNCGNFNLDVKGDWINRGTFTYGTGTVTFNSNANQTITNPGNETFYNLTINKSAGELISASSLNVRNTLTLSQGNVNLPNDTLRLGYSTAANGTLLWTDGYIIGYMTRWLTKGNHDGQQVNFPIGVEGSYRAFKPTFTFTGAALATDGGSLTIGFSETAPGNAGLPFSDEGNAVRYTFMDGYWTVSNSGLATFISAYDLTLHGNNFQSFKPHSDGAAIRVLAWNQSYSNWYTKGFHADASGSTAYRNALDTIPSKFCFGSTLVCDPPTTSVITGDADVCTNETGVIYSVTNTSGSTYIWTFDNNGGTITNGANTNSITVSWGSTGMTDVVRVQEQNNCSLGESKSFDVDIHSIPASAITGDLSVPVSTAGVVYSAVMSHTSGYTYNWTVSGGTIVSGGTTQNVTIDWNSTPGDGIVSVTTTQTGCAASPSTSNSVLKYNVVESVSGGDWDDVGFLGFGATWNCQCTPSATDNVKINTGHVVNVAAANRIVNHVTVEAGGELAVANHNGFIITGDFIINGTVTGAQGLTLSGTDKYIGGVGGTITNTGGISITTGGKNIKPTANLTSTGSNITIAAGITVTNNGSITLTGRDLIGAGASSIWTNAANSTLNITGALLTTGKLNASALNNTIHYTGTGAQNIKTPESSEYYNLSFTGASTKTQAADLVVSGDLTINSGTLNGANFNLTIGDNWANAGNYTEGTGTVTFDGNAAQSITNTTTETFYNLVVNKSLGTLTLVDNINISQGLTMTSGNIDAATNNKTLTLGVGAEATLTHTSGTIIGNFNRYITATGAKLFPVGTTTVHHPITFDFNDNPTDGSLLVAFNSTDPGLNGTTFPFADGGGINVTDYFNDGYWSAQSTGLSTANLDLSLLATGFNDDGSFSINSATRILKRTTGAWGVEGTHVNAIGSTIYRNTMSLSAGSSYMFALGNSNCPVLTTPAITGPSDVCSSETGVIYSIPDRSNSCTWNITKGNLVSGQGTPSITVDWQATPDVLAFVRVIESSACYDAPQAEKEVTINSLPTSSISGAAMVFDNSPNWAYSVTARPGYTYTWSITAGNGTITADGNPTDNSILVSWGNPSAATIQVIGTKAGCSPAAAVTKNIDVFNSFFTITDGPWTAGATWQGGVPPLTTQNAKILNAVTISGNTQVTNFYIESGASLTQTGGVNLTVTGNYYNSGTHNAANGNIILEASQTGLVINGTGTINNVGDFQVNNQNFTISSSANLTINNTASGQLTIEGGVYLNNEGTLTVSNNIVAGNTSSTFNNKANAVLNIGGGLLTAGGDLIASATGNRVNYNGTGAQTIKNPQSNTYYALNTSTSGTKTMSGNLTVYGNLTIADASTLDASASNYDITLYGNWINTSSGGFNERSGNVALKGTGSQSITNASGETFYDLEVNQNLNQTTTLNNNISVSHNLLLSRGFINGGANLLRVSDNATTNGGNSISFVDGQVRKIGNDAFVFPTGDAGIWARIGISAPPTASSEFTAQYFATPNSNRTLSALPEILTRVSAAEYWQLSRDVGSDAVSTTLYWEDSTRSGIGAAAYGADLRVAHYNGTVWENVGQASRSMGVTGSITSNSMSAFSPITFGSVANGNPLPVEMLYFEGKANAENIELYWATASEKNNDYFEVQRSIDAQNFVTIGRVYGAGNSMVQLNYTYIDKNPNRGTSYYRLKQVDYDGAVEIHNTIAVSWDGTSKYADSEDILVYPNPYNGGNLILGLQKLEPYTSINLSIIDISGKQIYRAALLVPEDQNVNIVPRAVDGLRQGIYFISVQTTKKVMTKKVIVN